MWVCSEEPISWQTCAPESENVASVRGCLSMPSTWSGCSLTSGCTNIWLSFSRTRSIITSTGCAPRCGGELGDGRIVPVDALHGEEVGVVGLARIGGGRAAALEHVVARLHRRLVRDQLPARGGVGEAALLLGERQRAAAPATPATRRTAGRT